MVERLVVSSYQVPYRKAKACYDRMQPTIKTLKGYIFVYSDTKLPVKINCTSAAKSRTGAGLIFIFVSDRVL